jgi:hypothetical protein
LTIGWNLNGFRAMNVLPKGTKFNADYYITNVFIPLAEWRKAQVGRIDRKLILYAGNTRSILQKRVWAFGE